MLIAPNEVVFTVNKFYWNILAVVLKELGWTWASGTDLTTYCPLNHWPDTNTIGIYVHSNKIVTWDPSRSPHTEQLTKNIILQRLGLEDVNEIT